MQAMKLEMIGGEYGMVNFELRSPNVTLIVVHAGQICSFGKCLFLQSEDSCKQCSKALLNTAATLGHILDVRRCCCKRDCMSKMLRL